MNLDTLEKDAAESRVFDFDYTDTPEIIAGQTIASVETGYPSATPSTGITIGSPIISGPKVQFLITAGTPDQRYLIKCLAVTSAGRKIMAKGYLKIEDDD